MKFYLLTLMSLLASYGAAQGISNPSNGQFPAEDIFERDAAFSDPEDIHKSDVEYSAAEIFKRGSPKVCNKQLAKIPKCAKSCYANATKKFCKSGGDFKCRCKHNAQISRPAEECSARKCSEREALQAAEAEQGLCKCVKGH